MYYVAAIHYKKCNRDVVLSELSLDIVHCVLHLEWPRLQRAPSRLASTRLFELDTLV